MSHKLYENILSKSNPENNRGDIYIGNGNGNGCSKENVSLKSLIRVFTIIFFIFDHSSNVNEHRHAEIIYSPYFILQYLIWQASYKFDGNNLSTSNPENNRGGIYIGDGNGCSKEIVSIDQIFFPLFTNNSNYSNCWDQIVRIAESLNFVFFAVGVTFDSKLINL